MPLKIGDIVIHPEVGQHWAILNPVRLARVDGVGDGSGSIQSVEFTTWTPQGRAGECWILPLVPGMACHLWYTSLIKIEHFMIPPSEGSVWVVNQTERLFFVGDRSTEYPDKVWVYTDYEFEVPDSVEMAWTSMREIQSGPVPAVPFNHEQTALEQVLAEED